MQGSRNIFRTAFSMNLLEDGDMWMQMIISCNRTVHTYDEGLARDISRTIVDNYLPLLRKFAAVMRGEMA